MTHHEPEALADADPHSLLFGSGDEAYDDSYAYGESRLARRRGERKTRKRHRRNGRFVVLLVIVILGVVAWLVGPPIVNHFKTKKVADYTGSGTGSVRVNIVEDATASDIAATLYTDGVVASAKAFTDAAMANSASTGIEAGAYMLRLHMSAKSALAALLDPSTRLASSQLLVFEGATVVDVRASLLKALGASQTAAITAALDNPAALGLPLGYGTSTGGAPTSVEGFLFPATYDIDPSDSPQATLEKMVARFIEQDRSTGFAEAAKAAGITPYQALIIASIAQAEAKFPADMAKVARVILNRIKANQPLQIDATSAYAAKLAGLDPTSVTYANVKGPYNTYVNAGLPPTPISNPGAAAMDAAVHPEAGNWLFYVNGDAAGHLVFTNSATVFAADVKKCHDEGWGCAAP